MKKKNYLTKKMFMLAGCMAMTLAISTGCEDEPMPIISIPPPPPVQEYVILKFGDTVDIPNSDGMKISFDDVLVDMRIPMGWAHTSPHLPCRAFILLSLLNAKEKNTELTLSIHGGGAFEFPLDFDYDDLSNWKFLNCITIFGTQFCVDTLNYRFELVGLIPYPDLRNSTDWFGFLRHNKHLYTAKIYFKKLEEEEI